MLEEPGGFSLSLVTESFAVRALLGSVAAAGLAALLVGVGVLRSCGARRAALLAPAAVAVVAGVASVGEAFLPRLLVAGGITGDSRILDHFGEYRGLSSGWGMDLLLVGYVLMATILVGRRLLGLRFSGRLFAFARELPGDDPLVSSLRDLAGRMGVRPPRLLLLDGCPGGACTGGLLRPAVVVDPQLMATLDSEEREGLLAHELAHVARRDGLVGTAVGLARDIAWFLVPLHVVAGWLAREQEESADELASRCTGRPAALASGILKVWDAAAAGPRAPAPATCAAVATARAPSSVVLFGRSDRSAARIVTARVERLIALLPAPSRIRRRTEALLAVGVAACGAAAALTVPSWIASDLGTEELAFLYLASSPPTATEAPAFATFRAITPADGSRPAIGASAAGVVGDAGTSESQAELLAGQRRDPVDAARLTWGHGDRAAWDVAPPAEVRPTRPVLYTQNDAGSQVGVFLVGNAER